MTIQEAFNIGLGHHHAGRLAEAEGIYRQILSQQPNQPDVLHLLGLIAQHAGRRDAAMQLIGQAISVSPNRAEFHGSLGLLLEQSGRLDEAVAAYRKALAVNPNLPQASNNLANALAAKGQTDEAIALLRQAMAAAPNYADPPFNLANLCAKARQFDQAVDLYGRALALRPNWSEAHNNLGAVHKERGQMDQAAACFQRALALSPDYLPALNNFGTSMLQAGRFEQAAACFGRAVTLNPGFAEGYFHLGNCLASLDRLEESAAAFRQALALRADFAEAHNNLGRICNDMNNVDEAIACYRRAVAARPDYAEAHGNLGLACQRAGLWDDAATALGQALALRPDDPAIYRNLTRLWRQRSKIAAAQEQVIDPLPRLPYLGDKVVLLRCDRPIRERLRQAGLHGGYAVDPRDGAETWLTAHLAVHHDPDKLPALLGRWLELLRNEAAMEGATGTVWMPQMPEAVVIALRQAAGEDLIEIAGDSAQDIHARLAALAVAPPDTEDKIFALVDIRYGVEMLPHWLEHYSRLGVDEMLVGIFDDVAGEFRQVLDQCHARWKFRTFVQHRTTATDAEQYSRRQTGCRQAGAGPRTWIMHTDLDEFHEYPAPIHQITTAADEAGINVIRGHFVDRLAADGSLPPLRSQPSLWEQFPIACKLTEKILKGMTQKVMLARYRVHVGLGHHTAGDEPVVPPPIGTADDYRVAHFKWHGDVLPRMRQSSQQKNWSQPWKADVRRFFQWLDRHGGRIDLSDPALEAHNTVESA